MPIHIKFLLTRKVQKQCISSAIYLIFSPILLAIHVSNSIFFSKFITLRLVSWLPARCCHPGNRKVLHRKANEGCSFPVWPFQMENFWYAVKLNQSCNLKETRKVGLQSLIWKKIVQSWKASSVLLFDWKWKKIV